MMGSYGGYVERLAKKVEARLQDIEAIYNFDLGDEFELAPCTLLEDVLPAKYGVCRGFVVAEDGRTAGDDVIIYDKMASPTLRSSLSRQFPMKEQIPVDAVYAHIECKHSIATSEVLEKAIGQAEAVKKLVLTCRGLDNLDYEKDGPAYNGRPRDWPRTFAKASKELEEIERKVSANDIAAHLAGIEVLKRPASRPADLDKLQRVLECKSEGLTKSQTARRLGLSRSTIGFLWERSIPAKS